MNLLIYGCGAVGLGIGSCLLKAGARVTLLARPGAVEMLHQHGLVRTGIFGSFNAGAEQFAAVSDLKDLANNHYDFILVCTKCYDTPAAASELGRFGGLPGHDGIIVLFQNGWGNAEYFTALFAEAKIYSARVITGFTRRQPHHVEITVHADAIHIGSLFGQSLTAVEPLANAIDAGGIPCMTTDSIEKDLWAKMLYNCALNPLGAILDVPYGALADSPDTRQIMNTIITEIYSVMNAAGFSTHWDTARQYEEVFYSRLVPPTAQHYSSTLQDLKAGRKTEIEGLTGQILTLARRHNVSVPCNSIIYRLIQFLQMI